MRTDQDSSSTRGGSGGCEQMDKYIEQASPVLQRNGVQVRSHAHHSRVHCVPNVLGTQILPEILVLVLPFYAKCFICKMSFLCKSALYAKCPYYVVLYM